MGDIKTWGMILKWGVDTPLRLCRGGKSNTVAACSFNRRINSSRSGSHKR